MSDKIEVSIITDTYNHEQFIAQTLESLINQKTTFKFEILVHDDASTDRTPDIIREYQDRYPNIIKAILQKENQYSQNVDITRNIQIPRAKGKYIAMCEGDDYWCDVNKLQKQFDAMEKEPDVNICATGAKVLRNERITGVIQPEKVKTLFSLLQVIKGGGGFVATASLMIRKQLFDAEIPEFRKVFPFDYTLQVWGAMNKGMLYLPDIMVAYRLYTPSSWSNSMRKNTVARIAHNERVIKCLKQMNIDTQYIAEEIIKEKIRNLEFDDLFYSKQFKTMMAITYKKQFVKCSLKKKLYIWAMSLMK